MGGPKRHKTPARKRMRRSVQPKRRSGRRLAVRQAARVVGDGLSAAEKRGISRMAQQEVARLEAAADATADAFIKHAEKLVKKKKETPDA